MNTQRIIEVLNKWLETYEGRPIGRIKIAEIYDEFRAALCDPWQTPEGVSVDSLGLPDAKGIQVLIETHTEFSRHLKDAILTVLQRNVAARNSIFISDDSPNADPEKELIRLQREINGDYSAIYRFTQAIRDAIKLLQDH